jgi:hypothetical protein
MKSLVVFFLFILFPFLSFSQTKFWLEFKDKNIQGYEYQNHLSPRAVENRIKFNIPLYQFSDVPVSYAYLDSLKMVEIPVQAKSKWLNSVSVTLTKEQMERVKKFSFVKGIHTIDPNIKITSTSTDVKAKSYSFALGQMNINAFSEAQLTGKGVAVGVIDAGFYRAYSDKSLYHLMNEDKIKAQRDFINPERKDIVNEAATDSDSHGAMVVRMISGYDEKDKAQYGFAVNAELYLARTENGAREHRGEEDHWIEAMEWMDSLGIRLINTSLGYAINMDDPKENYKLEDMDGKTARISRAAQIAVDEKGIFLVVSAGNEGSNPNWTIVSAPADAEGVLSVGATKDKVWEKIGYSSIGPDFLPYMKPNVSCYSPNGTSFSAPTVAGFVACLMEKAPHLNNKELKKIIERSGHLYPYGNNYIGYGVPQADRALRLIEDSQFQYEHAEEKRVKDDSFVIKEKRKYLRSAVVFHKKNATQVVSQEVLKLEKDKKSKGEKYENLLDEKSQEKLEKKLSKAENKKKKVTISRPAGVERSTVYYNGNVIELIWEK